jgi:hypothetical protein
VSDQLRGRAICIELETGRNGDGDVRRKAMLGIRVE